MRMILVHGISQEGKSSDLILSEWLTVLRAVYAAQGIDPLGKLSRIQAPFYGDHLARLSASHVSSAAIALGTGDAFDDFDEFAVEALEAMAGRMGVTRVQIEQENDELVIAQGAGAHKTWIKAIARAIEKVSPLHGTLALRVLGQAHAYIRNQHVHDEVNALVRPAFDDDEPIIVVSHSLGTIVAYSLLREFAKHGKPRQCPLLVTLGSPLGINSVRKGFAPPRIVPPRVSRWVNGADPEDFVALRAALGPPDFPAEIINFPDIENGYENPHSIAGYLRDARIAKATADAIG